jgi:hypothetical protein
VHGCTIDGLLDKVCLYRWSLRKLLYLTHPTGGDVDTLKSEISAIEELVAEVGTDSKCKQVDWSRSHEPNANDLFLGPLQALVHYKTLLASHDPAAKSTLLQECKTLTEKLVQVDPQRRHMYEDQRKLGLGLIESNLSLYF